MKQAVRKEDVRKLLGKPVFAVTKSGMRVSGRLVKMRGNKIFLANEKGKASTKAILPLALFDLLAIGTLPYGYGYGFSGYPYGAYGYGSYGFPYGGYGYPYGWF